MKKQKIILAVVLIIVTVISLAACSPLKKPETGDLPPAAADRFKRGHNVPGKLYWAGSVQDKKVALTFDDGPEENWTPKILDILKEKKVKATFFVIGQMAQAHPDMLKRIYQEGHVIGNHTFHHVDLQTLSTQQVEQEIETCADVIRKTVGKTPRLVRPPFGFHNAEVDNVIYSKDRIIVLWSLDTEDWQGPDSETIKARILPKMQNGYIILQHDGMNPKLGGSLQALPDIIDELKAQGYVFVTISDLLDTQPYQ